METLRANAETPIRLPSPEEVAASALRLREVLDGDPVQAREALRLLFRDGRITLTPTADGYEARGEFLPLLALEATKPPTGVGGLVDGRSVARARNAPAVYNVGQEIAVRLPFAGSSRAHVLRPSR